MPQETTFDEALALAAEDGTLAQTVVMLCTQALDAMNGCLDLIDADARRLFGPVTVPLVTATRAAMKLAAVEIEATEAAARAAARLDEYRREVPVHNQVVILEEEWTPITVERP